MPVEHGPLPFIGIAGKSLSGVGASTPLLLGATQFVAARDHDQTFQQLRV
jgi:hypothetical protein